MEEKAKVYFSALKKKKLQVYFLLNTAYPLLLHMRRAIIRHDYQ